MGEFRESFFPTICGWVALVCIAVAFGVPLFEVMTGIRFPRTVWPGLMLVASFPLALIWLVGTLVHRSRVRRARIQAEAFAEAARRMNLRPQAGYVPNQVRTSGVPGFATPAAVPPSNPAATASSPSPSEPGVYTYSAPGMPLCPLCGQRPIIFYCSTHHSAVCLDCVPKRDEPRKCVYLPAYRAPKDAAKLRSGGKTGSILGID